MEWYVGGTRVLGVVKHGGMMGVGASMLVDGCCQVVVLTRVLPGTGGVVWCEFNIWFSGVPLCTD